ncbi:tetratricopeptide repeat protein [Streptomyces eurocidicus]|nr:tetratricopeptide repeat protein [Streptomyces eurocidicus]MBF6052091.1 tetratricopeptide repeat protein [Streptomyces eurocidicus]
MSSLERKPHTPDNTVTNVVSDGLFLNAVIQGRDITVHLPREISPALAGLPPCSPSFSGREEQLHELTRGLAPDRRALPQLILGLPGVGKTEIALQVATRAQRDLGWFTGGVLFTDMQGYDETRHVTAEQSLSSLLRALAIPPEHIPYGLEERSRLFRTTLAAYAKRGCRILLVVDNASSADQVQPLLPSDAVNSILITSRDNLDLSARRHSLEILSTTASISLLQNVLTHTNGVEDVRVKEDLGSAEEIADLCGNLPIALQICGALLADFPSRSLASMKQALSQAHTRLGILERGTRSVTAAFDISYRRLTKDQARLFRLIPINPGADISSSAAAQLAGIEESAADRLLEDLARMHLVEPGDTWGRWRLHNLIRLYADSLSRECHVDDRRDLAFGRLLDYYVHGAHAASSHLTPNLTPSRWFMGQRDALRWLDSERSNLILAVGLAIKTGEYEASCVLANELATYLQQFHHADDFLAVSYAATKAANMSGNKTLEDQAISNTKKALTQLKSLEDAIKGFTTASSIFSESNDLQYEASTLSSVGHAMSLTGNFEEAITHLTTSAELYRKLRQPGLEGLALASLGEVLASAGKPGKAVDAYCDSLELLQQAGDLHGVGLVLGNLGLTRQQMDQPTEALRAFKSALAIFQESGSRAEEGKVLNSLGLTLQTLGESRDAIDCHSRAISIARDVRDHDLEGSALVDLGIYLRSISRLAEAADAFADAARAFANVGDNQRKASALQAEGVTFTYLGRYQEAVDAYSKAEYAFRIIGDGAGEGMSLANRGAALRSWGRLRESIEVLTAAVDVLSQAGGKTLASPATLQLGGSLAAAGRSAEAVQVFARAAEEFARAGDMLEEAKALLARGIALRSLGRFSEAATDLTHAIAVFREEGDRERATMARLHLDEIHKGFSTP